MLTDSTFMNRYGIFKRTMSIPLYNPYFVNYGGDKEFFFFELNTLGRFSTLILLKIITTTS